MRLSCKFFIEDQGRYILGPGRMELLRAVDEEGSLRQAARKLGMSYRWAWGRLNDMEKALGKDLLTHGNGAAKTLTPAARELLDWYSGVEGRIRVVLDDAQTGMPEFPAAAPAVAKRPAPKKRGTPLD